MKRMSETDKNSPGESFHKAISQKCYHGPWSILFDRYTLN